jgi:hypothetical protein
MQNYEWDYNYDWNNPLDKDGKPKKNKAFANHYISFKVNYNEDKGSNQKNIVIDAPKSPSKTPDGQEINLLE